MKLHYLLSIVVSLYLATTTLYAAEEYSYYFLHNECGYKNNQGCWLKVITDEDNGGLRCRGSASLKASIMEVVPKDRYVQVIDLAISETGRAFFKTSRKGRICYMRATQDRFSYSKEYTYEFFRQQGCEYTQNGCSFEVITSEDNGGLRCRASASVQSSIIEVVPKGRDVPVIDLAISDKGKTFFKVSRSGQICYMRATQSRFSFVGKAKSTRSAKMAVGKAEIIMTGAGVRLRKTPQKHAKIVTQLQIGTIVFLLDRKKEWYRIAMPNGYKGWVLSKYTMSLDNFNHLGKAYIEVANRKINSNDFGDLAELCNFLNRVSLQVTKQAIADKLKQLHLVALQRSLEKIPRHRQYEPRYSEWLEKQRSKIEYNQFTEVWSVKRELFQQKHETHETPQNQTKLNNQKTLFITHLSFMDASAGMPLESSISNPINQAVIAGIQLAQQDMPYLKLNESGHKIDNSDEKVNEFVNLFLDFNLTKSKKIEAIVQKMMIPNRVDVILTGQYLEKVGDAIHVRPFILFKNNRRMTTTNFIFQKKDFICSNNALCQGVHTQLRDAVRELLGNL
ncbi:MAG: hypothetical protein DRQ57_12985 [Gammaproteobacteria bacterium]|nr:MAG: hypothetical protein DRQ57_12985 [Gammaproteobacteria bacterium]